MNEPYTDKELRRIQREDHRSPTTLRFLATVARLQERVEEAEGHWKRCKDALEKAIAWREEKRTYTLPASWFAVARATIKEGRSDEDVSTM